MGKYRHNVDKPNLPEANIMTTYDEYYEQCMTENPTQTATINGEEIVLTEEECCESCKGWATMKVEQDQQLASKQ